MKSVWNGARFSMAFLLAFVCGSWAQSPPRNSDTGLGGTAWQLVGFQGGDGKTLAPVDKTRFTLTFDASGRVSARMDCNRGTGTWKSQGSNELRFGPLALTRAMCPPDPVGDRLPRDLDQVRSYTIRNGHLFLSLMADSGNYEWEPLGTGEPAAAGPPLSVPPASGASVESKGPIRYRCTRTSGRSVSLTATFYETTPALVLVEWGRRTRPAFQVPAASGAKYEGQDVTFWEKQGEAMVTWSGLDLTCKQR